jgi:hypothetical protein
MIFFRKTILRRIHIFLNFEAGWCMMMWYGMMVHFCSWVCNMWMFSIKNLDDVVRFRGWICMEQNLVCFLCHQEKSTDHKLYIIKKYNQVKVICHPTSIRAKNSQIIIYLSYWYLGARFRFLLDPIVRLIV